MKEHLTTITITILFNIVKLGLSGLSHNGLKRLASLIATTAIFFNAKKTTVLRNLQSAFGERYSQELRQQIYQDTLRNSCLVLLETLWIQSLGKEKLFSCIRYENLDCISTARNTGKGTIIMAGHFGNWEIQAMAITHKTSPHYYSFTGKQKIAVLDRGVNKIRQSMGVNGIAYSASSTREIIKLLRNNEILGFINDGKAQYGSHAPTLFNTGASIQDGVGILAAKLDCPVIFSWITRDNDLGFTVKFKPLEFDRSGNVKVDAKRILSAYICELERVIEESPSEYNWIYKRYKKRPSFEEFRLYHADRL